MACREFGPSDRLVLEEVPDPRPGPGEVLVGVRAAGVSFVDGLMVSGGYQLKPPLPFTPGLVAAGEVLDVGAGVSSVARGSRVVSSSFDLGGYATHRVLPADAVVPLPDAVSFDVAATAVESYATILFALTRRTAVRPSEWVLVLGAGGGIGLAAVDVAGSLGARVIAAASSPAKRAAAINAGAQAAVDYQTEDLKVTSSSVSRAARSRGCRSTGCCWKTGPSSGSTGAPGPARSPPPTPNSWPTCSIAWRPRACTRSSP
jgi:NADPH2:quinone reductase